MRILIKTSPSKYIVPFDHQHKLVGLIHKWLGENDLHGKLSMMSFSWLKGGIKLKEGLIFPKGAELILSFYDNSIITTLLNNIEEDPMLFGGMGVIGIEKVREPDFSNTNVFKCGSPVFVRRRLGNYDIHFTFESEDSSKFLTETILNKMRKAGMPEDTTLKVYFDTKFFKRKTKLVTYKGVRNRVSFCPVVIEGSEETKKFIWNVGVGNSTGIGYGFII